MPRHFSTHKIVCWRVTGHCNRACRFCLSLSTPKGHHPTTDGTPIMASAFLGVQKIFFSGGEPMEFPNFDRLIERGGALGIVQTMPTTGDQLAKKIPPW